MDLVVQTPEAIEVALELERFEPLVYQSYVNTRGASFDAKLLEHPGARGTGAPAQTFAHELAQLGFGDGQESYMHVMQYIGIMPRIAKPHTEDSQRMRQQLQEYLNRKHITANRLASLAKVGQPTVSRFLTGRTKTVTPAISKVLTYAGIDRPAAIQRITKSVDNSRLRAALERNWDGTAEGADKLALLIDAIGPMLRSMRLDSAKGRSK